MHRPCWLEPREPQVPLQGCSKPQRLPRRVEAPARRERAELRDNQRPLTTSLAHVVARWFHLRPDDGRAASIACAQAFRAGTVQIPKLTVRVRFPSSAPLTQLSAGQHRVRPVVGSAGPLDGRLAALRPNQLVELMAAACISSRLWRLRVTGLPDGSIKPRRGAGAGAVSGAGSRAAG